jgi:hypothetical protein
MPLPSSKLKKGLSVTPPSGRLNTNNDTTRHSFDSSTHVYKSSTRSSAIPRGNGHQAMSIPMPPPPSLYFSLLPGNSDSRAGVSSTSVNSSTGAHSSPIPSSRANPKLHIIIGNGNGNGSSNNKDNSNGNLSRTRSKQLLHPHSDPSTPIILPHSLSITSLNPMSGHYSGQNNGGNNRSGHSTPKSAPNSRPSSNPNTPRVGPSATGRGEGVGGSHYHTHHHSPRSMYPLSMTHSRRSSLSHIYGNSATSDKMPDQRQKRPGG